MVWWRDSTKLCNDPLLNLYIDGPTVKSGLDSRTGGLTDLEDFVIWHTLKHTQLAAGSQELVHEIAEQ